MFLSVKLFFSKGTFLRKQPALTSVDLPTAGTLEPFASIPQGAYSLRVKLAGTQTLALQPVNLSSLNVANGIFTLYAAGTTQGQPLTANVVRNY